MRKFMLQICSICGLEYLLQHKNDFHSSQIRSVKRDNRIQSCLTSSERQCKLIVSLSSCQRNVIKPASHLDQAMPSAKKMTGERVNKTLIVQSGVTSRLLLVRMRYRFHDNKNYNIYDFESKSLSSCHGLLLWAKDHYKKFCKKCLNCLRVQVIRIDSCMT